MRCRSRLKSYAAFAAGAASVPRAGGCLGEDAIHRNRCRVVAARRSDRGVQAAEDQHVEYRPGEKVRDSVWRHPNLIFGALGIFAYVGAEVSIGSFLVNYFRPSGHCGFVRKDCGRLRLVLLGRRHGRRFLGAAVLRRIKTGHLWPYVRSARQPSSSFPRQRHARPASRDYRARHHGDPTACFIIGVPAGL